MQHLRQTSQDTHIEIQGKVSPYPSKAHHILDKPRYDGGGNFGRLARTGITDSYMQKLSDVQLCGIKTDYWRQFLKAFQESTTDVDVRIAFERLRRRIHQASDTASPKAHSALVIIAELERLLDLSD
jgi:hypothetical protein